MTSPAKAKQADRKCVTRQLADRPHMGYARAAIVELPCLELASPEVVTATVERQDSRLSHASMASIYALRSCSSAARQSESFSKSMSVCTGVTHQDHKHPFHRETPLQRTKGPKCWSRKGGFDSLAPAKYRVPLTQLSQRSVSLSSSCRFWIRSVKAKIRCSYC